MNSHRFKIIGVFVLTFALTVTLAACDMNGNDVGNGDEEANFVVEFQEEDELTLFVGEAIFLDVLVSNTGDVADEQEISLTIYYEDIEDSEDVRTETVELDSGESEEIQLDSLSFLGKVEGKLEISSKDDADTIDFEVDEIIEDGTEIDEETLNAGEVSNSPGQTQEIEIRFSQLRDEDSKFGPVNWIDLWWNDSFENEIDPDFISGLEDLDKEDIQIETGTGEEIGVETIGGHTADDNNYLNLGLEFEGDEEGIEDVLEDEDDSIIIEIDNLNFEEAEVNSGQVEVRLFHFSDFVDWEFVDFDIN